LVSHSLVQQKQSFPDLISARHPSEELIAICESGNTLSGIAVCHSSVSFDLL